MVHPLLRLVGHCTSTTASIFCAAAARGAGDAGAGSPGVARLAWRASGRSGHADLELSPAEPYGVGVFRIEGLPPGACVSYAIAVAGDAAALPPAQAILAAPVARSFRLLPADRPLRFALLSCNAAHEVHDAKRRFAVWRRLREQVDLGDVDLLVHVGDQVYADAIGARSRRSRRNPKDPDALDRDLAASYRRLSVEEAWQVTGPPVSIPIRQRAGSCTAPQPSSCSTAAPTACTPKDAYSAPHNALGRAPGWLIYQPRSDASTWCSEFPSSTYRCAPCSRSPG